MFRRYTIKPAKVASSIVIAQLQSYTGHIYSSISGEHEFFNEQLSEAIAQGIRYRKIIPEFVINQTCTKSFFKPICAVLRAAHNDSATTLAKRCDDELVITVSVTPDAMSYVILDNYAFAIEGTEVAITQKSRAIINAKANHFELFQKGTKKDLEACCVDIF